MPGVKNFLKIVVAAKLLICFFVPAGLCQDSVFKEKIAEIEKSMILEGDYEESIKELEEMLKIYPGDSRVYMDLGLAYYGLMEYMEAYDYFKKSEEAGPGRDFRGFIHYVISKMDENRDMFWDMEEAKIQLGKAEEADAVTLKESISAGHYILINSMLDDKLYCPTMATAHIVWLKNNEPASMGLYRLSGDIYYSACLYGKAEEDYKKAIEMAPGNAELHQTLADCLVAAGAFDSAQEHYQKSIDLYREQGIKETDPVILKLKRIKKAMPKKYEDIAELMEKGRYTDAEKICRKRISLNPGDYAAITQLGQIYWKKGKRRRAIRLFRRAMKIAPDYPSAHFFLGRAYVFENKLGKAVKEFDIFKEKMELLPKTDKGTVDFYVSALHYISYMYSTLKEYEKAEKESEKIIELRPDDQRAHYNLAVVYYNHYHNLSRTYGELCKVIEIDPNTSVADAARYYIDYIRRNPDSRFISDFTFLYEED